MPDAVARLDWLSFTSPDAFDRACAALITTIETDLDLVWARAHARLLVRARDWGSHAKDPSYLGPRSSRRRGVRSGGGLR